MNKSKPFLIYNASIVYGESCKIFNHCAILIKNSIISEIYFNQNDYQKLLLDDDISTFDAENNLLGPGLIDMHIHGCGGVDTSSENREEALFKMARILEKNGITTFQPTLLYDYKSLVEISMTINNNPILKNYIPGLYIEGPFINKDKKGGIPLSCIIEPNVGELKKLLDIKIDNKCAIKTMTIAPELNNIESIINILEANDIIVALGHSDATISDIPKLNKYHFTHLFNAMSGISHKKPGLAMYPFMQKNSENISCEIIGDGIHIAYDTLKFAFNCLNKNQICLISDSMKFAEIGSGTMQYCNKEAYCDGKACYYRDDDTLIGSCTLIFKSAKSLLEKNIITKEDFFRIGSVNPARILNLTDRGSIKIGKIADLVLVDSSFNILKVFKQHL